MPQKHIGVRIANEILMMLRNEKKKMREVSLFEPVGIDKDGNNISFIDVIETNEKEVHDRCELRQDILKLYKVADLVLDAREKDIIYSRYGLAGRKELPQRELAKKYDISRSYISRIEKRALQKLREGMEKTPD